LAEFVELQIEAGATFSTEITVNDATGQALNLSNYLTRSQMRKSYYSTTSTDFTLTVIDADNGIIKMAMDAPTTANLRAGRYVYDVEIESDDGTISRIFEGIVTVLPNVTR
jgi:hypothetical protein